MLNNNNNKFSYSGTKRKERKKWDHERCGGKLYEN